MKTKTLLFLILTIFFYCCDDSNEPKENIELIPKKIYVWKGEEKNIEVKTILSNPVIRIIDTSIAQAEYKDNIIHITTFKTGNTYMYVSDVSHNEASFVVIVGSIQGLWRESEWSSNSSTYTYEVEIQADNQEAANELKIKVVNDLKKNLNTAEYVFIEKDKNFQMRHLDDDEKIIKYAGIYEYDETQSALILKYNDITEIYKIYPFDYYCIKMMQDLTELYKIEYPSYGITKVLIAKYLLRNNKILNY